MNTRTADSPVLDYADEIVARARRAQTVAVPMDVYQETLIALEKARSALNNGGVSISDQMAIGRLCWQAAYNLGNVR